MQGIATGSTLCYISAAFVGTPIGGLAQLPLCGSDGAALGSLDGILVDSATGQCCYLVVKTDETDTARRNVIPVDALIRLARDPGSTRLEVDADALDEIDLDLDIDAIPAMSDEDLMAAFFGRSH